MSSTGRKAFLQRDTSTAAERKAYRAKARKERDAYWASPENRAIQDRINAAHAAWVAAGMPREDEPQ